MRTGIVMMDDMDSNQIAVSMTLEDTIKKEKAYQTADEVMGILTGIDGIKKVAGLDGNASVTSSMMETGATDNYTTFTFNIITEENIKTTKEFRKIRKDIENKTKNVRCKKLTVSSSAIGVCPLLAVGGFLSMYTEKISRKLLRSAKML